MVQLTSDNHYIPRGYLSRWSADGAVVWEHKLVVPHEKYPLWRRAPLREAGARRHLYDAHIPGLARDHFERWLKVEVEDPAYRAIARVEGDETLSPAEWEALVRFAVAQDLRTLKSFEMHEFLEAHELPKRMEAVVKRAIRRMKSTQDSEPPESLHSPEDENPVLATRVTPEGDSTLVEMAMVVGSTSWMQSTKRLVRGFSEVIARQNWQILRPFSGRTWPTSDHPVVRFEQRQGIAIHGTGWLRKNTEVFFPLTPYHAIYAKVGSRRPRPDTCSHTETYFFVRMIVGHAHRSVFSYKPEYKWVEWEKRRYVDLDEFNESRPGRHA